MKAPYLIPSNTALTAEQVKAKFVAAGVSISEWARSNNYSPQKVYFVINGQLKGHRGEGHKIAVALGLKLRPELVAA